MCTQFAFACGEKIALSNSLAAIAVFLLAYDRGKL
jgi:hypothetical protein